MSSDLVSDPVLLNKKKKKKRKKRKKKKKKKKRNKIEGILFIVILNSVLDDKLEYY